MPEKEIHSAARCAPQPNLTAKMQRTPRISFLRLANPQAAAKTFKPLRSRRRCGSKNLAATREAGRAQVLQSNSIAHIPQ
jgi:hypothetical protein